MQINRLRLSGFKSFVDPVDFPIAPGLTGVIGPNGCGKSNLLEALRWVMGATSAKALRGEGMDDVIFAGAAGRPPRTHAEVTIDLDNTNRDGPAAFAAAPLIQVSRRIVRGQGSTFRINGAEARARDVQLLFADASTGANSPALVRQGQISELIAAKPQNRRRILEEAAGVGGLHGRRHEALLRLRAAEANLARLEDVAREVEVNAQRLRREARTAVRYKLLAEEIRQIEAGLVLARWREAEEALRAARAVESEASRRAEEAVRAAARASAALLEAEAPLARQREEVQIAAAVRARLALDIDRAERDLAAATAERERLTREIVRLGEDSAREAEIGQDAALALARLEAERARLEAEIRDAPERLPALEEAATEAEAGRARAEAALEALTARLAAREAERGAAQAARDAAQANLVRMTDALARARAERDALAGPSEAALIAARAAREAAEAGEAAARQALEDAEADRSGRARIEAEARDVLRAALDERASAKAEADGLARLTRSANEPSFPQALEAIDVASGLEPALAAALGDDLAAALDPKAASFWGGGPTPAAPDWPPGVEPLAVHVKAPAALTARLALIGLATRMDGPRLQPSLPVGARLVSREGDLWRWDGFVSTAQAPRPAQVRLEQRNRLAALETRVATLHAAAEAAREAHAAAASALRDADQAVLAARAAPGPAASRAAAAREALLALEREATLTSARRHALDDTVARLEAEQREAQDRATQAADALATAPEIGAEARAEVAAARETAGAARERAFAARTERDREQAAKADRESRLASVGQDQDRWRRRGEEAKAREAALEAATTAARTALERADEAPAVAQRRRQDLAEQDRLAHARETAAADALQGAEATRGARERDLRQAEAAAGEARAELAAARARLEAAVTRRDEAASEVRETTGREPDSATLSDVAPDAPSASSAEGESVDHRLGRLRGELASLGAVNLRAEEDLAELAPRLAELAGEREDLLGALTRLRRAIEALEAEGRERLIAAFQVIDGHFRDLFTTLFQGGEAQLRLVESADPLESGLEIYACPPGKRLTVMSLMSGGEQALTATALIFAVFLAHPAPICVLDEVDAPLDDANVERFCNLLDAMRARAATRFLAITHNPLTMSRMDRLFGVTMREKGVSQLVSVDLGEARALAAT
jgi:chromosome segregation protein